jgi:NADH dehydrogenase FAD-containing subunit/uncharacterized membrane protein YphA (DoxX/SURF4 family)
LAVWPGGPADCLTSAPPANPVGAEIEEKAGMQRVGDLMAVIRAIRQAGERFAGPLLDLVIRLWLAGIFWTSGLLKIGNWQVALELARTEYPVTWMDPVTAAWLGLAVELVCPVFVALGLMTRVMALPLLALSLIIQFAYVALPDHLFWAILFGWLMVRGPGALSLDHAIGPALARTALPFAAGMAAAVDAITRYGAPAYQLFLRLWMAEIFWRSGLTKFASWETTVLLFAEEYKVPLLPPEIAAFMATATELGAPILLALGLGTRLAAVPLIVMTAVIQFTYLDRMEHWYWAMVLGQLLLRGPGLVSLDHLIQRLLARRFPQLDGKPAFSLDGTPRVVIVGAGFGGLACARGLARTPAQVTVIDRRNYHLFQPLLYQVATASLSPAPIRGILREQVNTTVLMERVTGIDRVGQRVLFGNRSLPYDYLVLATGARHSYFGKDDWEGVAPGIKKIDDATDIRRRILSAFERAEAAEDMDERQRLLTFVVVGAGPTGVELAGAIAELARFGMAGDFRRCDPTRARVILVQAGPRVLPSFPESLSRHALDQLKALGIEVRLDSRVDQVDEMGVVIGGERIHASTVLWAAGVIASPAAKWLGARQDRAGRAVVEADFSLPGCAKVFAIGDTALVYDGKGEPLPGVAPVAKQSGAYVARLIHARITGRTLPGAFRYRHMGGMATIGRKAAIADFGWLRLSGLLAWWLWGLVHVAFLMGARNRAAVMLDWAWAYLTFRSGVRLITGER